MQGKLDRFSWICLTVLLWTAFIGCQRGTKQRALPDKVPSPPAIEFTKPEEGWPPRPVGRTNISNVPWTSNVGALSEIQQNELRQAAVQDARVHTALGERFGFIAAGQVEPPKDQKPSANASLPVRLTFYSYSNNVAVDVVMREKTVEKVDRRPGYQPPEGAEEIAEAIRLAAQDQRLREAVRNMHATAIVTYLQEGRPGYGHRVLHVSFSAEGDVAPRYFALVDLTEQKVIAAGKPVGEEGENR